MSSETETLVEPIEQQAEAPVVDQPQSEQEGHAEPQEQDHAEQHIPKHRFEKIYKRMAEAENRARALEQQLQQSRPEEGKQTPGDVDPASYSTFEEYRAALADKVRADTLREFEREQQSARGRHEAENVLKTFQQKAAKAAIANPDLPDAIGYLDSSVVSSRLDHGVGLAILESDVSTDLMLELYRNDDILSQLIDAPARKALRVIGQIEERLKSKQAPTPARVPEREIKPTTGLRGGYSRPKDLNDPSLSIDEFSKMWDEQNSKRKK